MRRPFRLKLYWVVGETTGRDLVVVVVLVVPRPNYRAFSPERLADPDDG